jgi:hypothetical protein
MIQIGDCVRYRAQWLRSTGQYTGGVPFQRGTVTMFKDLGSIKLAFVYWTDGETSKVNVKNLEKC